MNIGKSLKIGIVIIFVSALLVGASIYTFNSSDKEDNQVSEQDRGDDGDHSNHAADIQLVSDLSGPFTVTYLGSIDGVNTLKVSSLSPIGRQRAITWIEQAGYDLSITRILFSDYDNPFYYREPS